MEVKHEGGHYFKVKYNWIQPGPVPTPATPATPESEKPKQEFTDMPIDTGFLKDWNLVCIEGETPVEAVPEDPKAKKTPAPKDKGKAGGQLEEITDNRPREINHTKDFKEEGLAAVKITEDFANYFESYHMNVEVYKVNRETQEETLKETYPLDMS